MSVVCQPRADSKLLSSTSSGMEEGQDGRDHSSSPRKILGLVVAPSCRLSMLGCSPSLLEVGVRVMSASHTPQGQGSAGRTDRASQVLS